MKILSSSLIVSLLLVSASAFAAKPSLHFLAATANDQVPSQLQSSVQAKSVSANLDHKPVSMSWSIDPNVALDARPVAFQQHSREYWIDADADQLQQGLALSTSANGALIRLSPHADNKSVIDASTLLFRANGKLYTSNDAVHMAADQDALRAAGMDVPEGSLVVKLADALGSGRIELVAPTASGSYLVHVFEPASTVVMSLQAERDTVLAGDSIRISAAIEGATLDRVNGLLSSPDGHSQDVTFTRQRDGSYVASVRPDPTHAGGFGLWQIHAFGNASNRQISVPRDARSAFAVSVATARLTGSIDRQTGITRNAGMTLDIGVQSVMPSRYQLAGTLYGTRSDGSLAPAAVAHSAAWLEAGFGSIKLRFDASSLSQSGMAAPYELRDLRLINQADMSLLERRERAASID
ncbi:MAG TPA: DUF4785 domain-containing protein [Dokdonella sp.]|uniref:DUF4785 domain-containing protein n=1 Tax=Dokdonella sp. TaxID=2291710 RepID=UPI002D7FC36F|nr:DUF4785 domain-containing protein [Dokdonella sp.]HET9033131.1 DUF4785 domain-containing protein [Dokdonella sp.]